MYTYNILKYKILKNTLYFFYFYFIFDNFFNLFWYKQKYDLFKI